MGLFLPTDFEFSQFIPTMWVINHLQPKEQT